MANKNKKNQSEPSKKRHIEMPAQADCERIVGRWLNRINKALSEGLIPDKVLGRPGGRRDKAAEARRATVQYHFEHLHGYRQLLDELTEEVATRKRTPEVFVKRYGVGDPTGCAVAELDARMHDVIGWMDVMKKTFRQFYGTPTGSVLTERYRHRLGVPAVCEKLGISQKTYHARMEKAFGYAELWAVQDGLVKMA